MIFKSGNPHKDHERLMRLEWSYVAKYCWCIMTSSVNENLNPEVYVDHIRNYISRYSDRFTGLMRLIVSRVDNI